MTLQFLIHNTPVDKKEAMALIESFTSTTDSPVQIELTKYIKGSFLNSKKLFELAVKQNNKDLVDVAWKVAAGATGDKEGTQISKPRATLYHRALPADTNEESFIEYLISRDAQWAVGAAMILNETSKRNKVTLKEIALNYVNNTDLPNNSSAFRGFDYSYEDSAYNAVESNKSVDRKKSFHLAPIYIALREGNIWCRENKLIIQEVDISRGGLTQTGEYTDKMQRAVYRLSMTQKGLEVVQLWADIDKFIDNYWMRH